MKTLRRFIRTMAWLMAGLIWLQSCTVYRSSVVSIDEAVKAGDKAKVVTKTDQTMHFKYLSEIDGQYYGMNKEKGELIKVPFEEEQIKTIRLSNKPLSTILSIGLPLVAAIGFASLAILGSGDLLSFD